MPEPAGPRGRFRLFGVDLASDFPFVSRLATGSGPADVSFACNLTAPPGVLPPAGLTPVFASAETTPLGESIASCYRLAGHDLLRFARLADFYLGAERIDCHLLDPRYDFLVELRLLGPVFAFWLERCALPVLHASAVAVAGRAVAFLAGSTGGKSTLAAALMTAGHPLLSDDLVAVEPGPAGEFLARASYPEMRLWPEANRRLVGDLDRLALVHPDHGKLRVPVGPGGFGAFAERSRPLARIYLPERREPGEGTVRIDAVPPREAVILLVRGSFIGGLTAAAGWQERRLEIFARLAERVPVRRLVYPSGLDELPSVRDAVVADLERD